MCRRDLVVKGVAGSRINFPRPTHTTVKIR